MTSTDPAVPPYEPRRIGFRDLYEPNGWRLKRYTIHRHGVEHDWTAYDDAWALVEAALPEPAVAAGRPGVGFAIAHQGAGVHYVVLGWWDNGNELPLRVWVKGFETDATWRPATGSESICVWDLEVIWFERNAYVETVMQAASDPDVYVMRRFGA